MADLVAEHEQLGAGGRRAARAGRVRPPAHDARRGGPGAGGRPARPLPGPPDRRRGEARRWLSSPTTGDGAWPYEHRIRIRYGEVDMQQVVFNAHYLAYCDVAISGWFESALGWSGPDDPVDWMLVKATVEWQGSATYGDELVVRCGVSRWGRTSFQIRVEGSVRDAPVFTADIVNVCVVPGTKDTQVVPDRLRAALGSAPAHASSRDRRHGRHDLTPIRRRGPGDA